MKLLFKKSDLIEGINVVMKAVSTKSSMKILECILIDATEGFIKFTANDMDLGIETKVKGEIKEAGKVAIEARIFSEIVRKLPDSEITFEIEDDTKSLITCENSKFNIQIMDPEDFSPLPRVEKNNKISISQLSLKNIIDQTIFAINDAEKNKVLTGELFEIKGNKLKVVALDKFRIAIRNIELKEEYDLGKVIIPGKSLNEISKILNGGMEDDVMIYFTNNHILFDLGDTVVVSRLIEDTNFFDTDKMISSDYKTKIEINKREFMDCIDRATLLIKEGESKPVFLTIKDGVLDLSINTFIGTMDEKITLYMTNSKAPCFIRNENNSYIYIVLPVVQ